MNLKGVDIMTKKSDIVKLVFLLLYFLILTVERIISLAAMLTGDFGSYDLLDLYMGVLTVVSIAGAYIYMLLKVRFTVMRGENGKVSAAPAIEQGVFGKLAVAAGILLLGGMVHTEGTIPPIQFAAYGMILISMAIHTAQRVKEYGGGLKRWISFGYIVAFSMAIPVVYHTAIELSVVFVPLEIIVSAGMVAMFTIMLKRFYDGDGSYGFSFAPFAAAAVGDAAVLMLRWNEEINFFVLIFICVTAALYIAGKIVLSSNPNDTV